MSYYTNNHNEQIELTDDIMNKAVELKLQLQKVNGNCNWGTLTRMLRQEGYEGIENNERFRVKVREFQKKIGKLPSVSQSKDQHDKYKIRLLQEQLGELSVAKREIQNLKRDFNKIRRELDDRLIFRRQLLDSLPDVVNIGQLPKAKQDDSGETLVVSISDIHVGLKTKDYNYEILKERMGYYLSQIKDYTLNYNVSYIIVAGLGDWIEGAYLHATQLYELEFEMGEQVTYALQLITNFLVGVRKLGIKTGYVAISGNHERSNGANKKDNLLGDSMIDVINGVIKEKSDDLGIEYIEPDSKVRHLLHVNGTNIALVHGDLDHLQDKSIISKLSSFFGDRVDSVLAGHLHSFWLMTLGFNQYLIQTSSAFNGNSYSDKLGVKNTPGQVMLSVDKQGVIVPHFIVF